MEVEIAGEYGSFRQEVAQFIAANWPDHAAADPKDAAANFRRKAVERGYFYRSVPREYGGSEQPPDPLRAMIIKEEVANAGAPRELEGPGVNMLVPTLLGRGEEWQKRKFIPPTLSGQIVWCQGYSEPSAGSDLASLRTRAVLEGNEWVVNGQKVWTSLAHRADYMFALVRTEPSAPKHHALTYMIIDMKQPGITVRPLRQMTGGQDFNEVFFDDARTPQDWIVGARGEGWQVSKTTLRHERNMVGGAGATAKLFDKLIDLARVSTREGEPVLKQSDVRQELARIWAYVEAQRYAALRQNSMELAEQDAGLISYLNKLNGTLIRSRIVTLAQELIGEAGLADSRAGDVDPCEQWIYHIIRTLGIAIAGGTSNIQRNIIAERGLGLPREPSVSA